MDIFTSAVGSAVLVPAAPGPQTSRTGVPVVVPVKDHAVFKSPAVVAALTSSLNSISHVPISSAILDNSASLANVVFDTMLLADAFVTMLGTQLARLVALTSVPTAQAGNLGITASP